MMNRWGMLKTGVLILASALAAVVLAAETSSLTQSVPTASMTSCDQRLDSSQAILGEDAADPEAACRIRPECDADEDCDAICGPGLGNCIHNKCPIRICRCG